MIENYLSRRLAAWDDLAEQIAQIGSIPLPTAHKVVNLYVKQKFAKYDGHRYTVKLGTFLASDVIATAARMIGEG